MQISSSKGANLSFPILVQERERDAWSSPTDVWQRTYIQGPTVDEDRVEASGTKVAARRRVHEHDPCFTGAGEAAYIRGDKKRPGLFAGKQALVEGPLEQAGFSATGRLAYIQEGELWLASAEGNPARQLTTGCMQGPVEDLEFSADGRSLWYCAGNNLFRYDSDTERHDGVPTRNPVQEFTLAPNGRALVYLDDRNGLHRLEPGADREHQLTQIDLTDPLADGITVNSVASPTFSPDGSRVLFCVHEERWEGDEDPFEAEGSTQASLWVVPARGGRATQVTYEEDVSRVAVPPHSASAA